MALNATAQADGQNRRAHPRLAVNHRARVLTATAAGTGAILDLSTGGARVRLDRNETLPDQLILVDLATGLAFECIVAWRAPSEIGVRFSRQHNLKGLVPAPLRLAKTLWLREGDDAAPQGLTTAPPPRAAPVVIHDPADLSPPPEPSPTRLANAALLQSMRQKLTAAPT